MAVTTVHDAVTDFDMWYDERKVDDRDGCIDFRGLSDFAGHLWKLYERYKREMDARVHNYEKLEKLADNEVISPKPDLPNISSGETAGIIRRIARNLVQHTPNVEVICSHSDESVYGIFARYILLNKIIGSDAYSNDMQQNLFASTKTSFTLGFACVIPLLLQDAGGSWYTKYDTIHYRDVFPEPGVKDIREAPDVFVRRYMTQGDIKLLLRQNVAGWDHAALRALLKSPMPTREHQSVGQQEKKAGIIPEGYEIITYYNAYGDPFLTFDGRSKMLLRIEKNKHPLKWHPVHFLVLEKDDNQPLGKSQVELVMGRQEFQDLMLNGAMKMWYRNINPPIFGYGAVNAVPNLGPGQYTPIGNPQARIEPFEVNTGTLQQYGLISQQNLGSMVQLVGAADQQMATQGSASPMSATPQGVEAQTAMVDITTNNYQKAIESFFSHYCSYALTVYFEELRSIKGVTPTADAREQLINAGLKPEAFNEKGELEVDFDEMATEYFVKCVPGSLVEMEDEKQLRILKEIFVPLSQAMPAMQASGDQDALKHAAAAMQFIVEKTISLSGSSHSLQLAALLKDGQSAGLTEYQQRVDAVELSMGGMGEEYARGMDVLGGIVGKMQQDMSLLMQANMLLLEKLGVNATPSTPESNSSPAAITAEPAAPATL